MTTPARKVGSSFALSWRAVTADGSMGLLVDDWGFPDEGAVPPPGSPLLVPSGTDFRDQAEYPAYTRLMTYVGTRAGAYYSDPAGGHATPVDPDSMEAPSDGALVWASDQVSLVKGAAWVRVAYGLYDTWVPTGSLSAPTAPEPAPTETPSAVPAAGPSPIAIVSGDGERPTPTRPASGADTDAARAPWLALGGGFGVLLAASVWFSRRRQTATPTIEES